jgi:hypothetical protein
MNHHSSPATAQLTTLQTFRQAVYQTLGPARDALFELTDAALLTPAPPSFAHLALSPVFRRRWPSLYEALQDERPDPQALLHLYLPHIQPTPTALATPQVVLAGDSTAWPRLWARTLPERAYWHAPTPVPAQRPLTIGLGFSTLSWVPEATGSWAVPLLHERIPTAATALTCAVAQLRAVSAALPPALGRPLALYDSQYGCAPFVQATASLPVDKILRLRPNLRLYRAPGPYQGRGPHPKHGPAFKLHDASTWGLPGATLQLDTVPGGPVVVQQWDGLHFRAAAPHPFTVVRIQRHAARGTRRDPKAQWLAWVGAPGAAAPPVAQWWAVYGRRFAQEHWYRFAKGSLAGGPPAGPNVAQAERWATLLPLLTWELWLARGVGADRPLPWQRPQAPGQGTPGRVAAGWGGIIAAIGTPTRAPKPRGKAPGWPPGQPRRRRERVAVVKKGHGRRASPRLRAARAAA